MGELVSLRRERKRRRRAEDEAAAEANRVRHGQSKALREQRASEKKRVETALEGHRLERGGPPATGRDEG